MRSSEQEAADQALTDAIERVRQAYFPIDAMTIINEYVVCVAVTEIEGDVIVNSTVNLYRDGDIPTHRAIGLFEMAKINMLDRE